MIYELEKMCSDADFDKERAAELLKEITDADQEFLESEYKDKTTLLRLAAEQSNYEMVKLLLENGANPKDFDEYTLIDMMFDSLSIDCFKSLWDIDKDAEKWGNLLDMCYCEESYESVGGDLGYLENPPINTERLKYLRELIEFLEMSGIKEVE